MGLEIELKFLIEKPLSYPDGTDVSRIEQYYLMPRGEYDARRVRARTRNGVTAYTYNEKRLVSGYTREENERRINKEEYEELLSERDPARNTVCKTRYAFPFGGHIMEIDVFDFWDKVAILEVELGGEGEAFTYPPELKIIADVTEDSRFLNKSLAYAIPDLGEFGI